jgi:hypothetical protein
MKSDQSRKEGEWGKTYVICKPIPFTIVTIGFLILTIPKIMFSDEMSSTRMQATSEKAGHYEIYERSGPDKGVEQIVDEEDDKQVGNVPLSESLDPNKCGSEGVK